MVFAWKNKQKKESVFPLFRVYLNNEKNYVNYLHSGESHLNAFASFFTCTFPDFTISNYQLGFRFKIFDIFICYFNDLFGQMICLTVFILHVRL